MPRKSNTSKAQKKSASSKSQPKQTQQRVVYVDRPAPVPQSKVSTLGRIGQLAGDGISKFFGLGAYKLQSNSLYSNVTGSQVPAMHSSSESLIFRHREYLGDISSSIAYTTQFSTGINPGLPSAFPYLSSIASNFQEYRFRGLIYEFKSTAADALNSTNTALGTIGMVAQYRADATVPTTKVQFLNEMWSMDAKPSESFILPIECAPKESPMNVMYVRSAALGPNQDYKFYDLAKIAVMSVGSQAAAVVGELWCTYEVELLKPVALLATGAATVLSYHGVAGSSHGNTPTAGSPLGVGGPTENFDNIGLTVTATVITIPAGLLGTMWSVDTIWTGASAACGAASKTYSAGLQYQNIMVNSTTGNISPGTGTTTTSFAEKIIISVTVNTATTITLDGTGAYPGSSNLDLFFTQLNANVV